MITLATLLRAFGPWGMPQSANIFIDASVFCWLVAYGIFIFHYGPMLSKARLDGRPG